MRSDLSQRERCTELAAPVARNYGQNMPLLRRHFT
jgi:hypothetical protein